MSIRVKISILGILILKLTVLAVANNASGIRSFLDLTEEEQLDLKEFREAVNESLTESFMSKDEYLLRFLKKTNYNLSSSMDLIHGMLKWRKESNIKQLKDEVFPEFDAEYNIYLEGCDNDNRPVPFGNWNIRQAVLSGLGDHLKRYIDKLFEDATSFLQSCNELGVEIYTATIILDLDGFDMKTHGCSKCIPIYLHFFKSLQTHYPGLVDKIYFVNTPQIVNLIWDVYGDVFTPELRGISTIYGIDPLGFGDDWKKNLTSFIPQSSLNRKLGGSKGSSMDFINVRLGVQLLDSLNSIGAVRVSNICEKDLMMYETLIKEMNRMMELRQTMEKQAKEVNWAC